ncbi:hypothetical protein B0H63DRAFT_472924 [Podospora didyma]|uniref:Uncharacterized protein n=1 Tax=Podospora didyma TaxID=330526 RepID=A0AAE0NPU9_9PEZI|nr:hypothetical protein B0H63DRAFT_472924 [Podospora didyma]
MELKLVAVTTPLVTSENKRKIEWEYDFEIGRVFPLPGGQPLVPRFDHFKAVNKNENTGNNNNDKGKGIDKGKVKERISTMLGSHNPSLRPVAKSSRTRTLAVGASVNPKARDQDKITPCSENPTNEDLRSKEPDSAGQASTLKPLSKRAKKSSGKSKAQDELPRANTIRTGDEVVIAPDLVPVPYHAIRYHNGFFDIGETARIELGSKGVTVRGGIKRRKGEFNPMLYPSLTTYNLHHTHRLEWKVKLQVYEKVSVIFEGKSEKPIYIAPPDKNQLSALMGINFIPPVVVEGVEPRG